MKSSVRKGENLFLNLDWRVCFFSLGPEARVSNRMGRTRKQSRSGRWVGWNIWCGSRGCRSLRDRS